MYNLHNSCLIHFLPRVPFVDFQRHLHAFCISHLPFGGVRGRTQVPQIVDWYMDGKISIDPLITHKLPLERINEAFDLMHSGESIRTVIEF